MKNKKLGLWIFFSTLVLFLVACGSQKESEIDTTMQITPLISSLVISPSPMPRAPSFTADTPIIVNDNQEPQNLDSWLGNYHYSMDVIQGEQKIYTSIDLIIYQTSEGFFGYFNVNENSGDLYERILVKVYGSEEEIQLVFLENISIDEKEQGTIFSTYQPNQLICTITENKEGLSATWSNTQLNQERYFVKSDSPASVIIRSMEDKNEFLRAFGIEKDDTPFYQYYDEDDNELIVDFYYNPEEKTGIGIYYGHFTMCGFETVPYEQKKWSDPTYLAEEFDSSKIPEYKEQREYNENKQLAHFYSTGIIEGYKDSTLVDKNIIDIKFIYRDDGTLARKDCFYNPLLFGGSTGSTRSYYYDKQEHIGMTSAYITHGSLENFYIYKDDSVIPSYCFSLDHSSWHAYAYSFIRYSSD